MATKPEFWVVKDENVSCIGDRIGCNFDPFNNLSNQILWTITSKEEVKM